MVQQVSVEKDAAVAPGSPGWIARVVIGLALIVAVLARLAGRLDDPPYPLDDSAIRNLIALISCFVAGLDDLRVAERCDCGCPSVFFAPAATLVHPEVGNSPLVEASAVTTDGVPVGVIRPARSVRQCRGDGSVLRRRRP